ncbi:ABC transporter ATP-binding protein [Desulfopila sp. IMCC35006]|uniref:ABC transporter ATP-binding protein n=1 Tax=Desulfopila sp. IMCC35006 TaxID=2569542 RepID=UPI0010ABFAEB|nr:ABC transporter ATP-binding protein [Desulfopila sp. IMCC35006]
MVVAVELNTVSRFYGEVRALDHISATIGEGEFFSMLGPSGSGKTTCLRLIAGFEQPTTGSILIHGKDATGVPPYERDVNTVFQDYALFPHMTNLENIEYGLKVKGVAKTERKQRAQEALAMVALPDLGKRKPWQLSGGQRQRIALARALVNRPRVLLLDEPLGALDLKLREQMQVELKALQRKLGITFIYVTHDQGEALSMSDRVAVFNAGRLEQIDTPQNLYMRPSTVFVANFVGTSNVVEGRPALDISGQPHSFSIRPEHISFVQGPPTPETIHISGRLVDIQYYGAHSRYEVEIAGSLLFSVQLASESSAQDILPRVGDEVMIGWSRRAMVHLGDL